MDLRYVECEVARNLVEKRDCADYRRLGWSKSEWHTHNRGQLIYAEYGIMHLFVGDRVYYIPSWHAAWVPQGMPHKLLTESQDLEFYSLYLDCTGLENPFYTDISIFLINHLLREMILYTRRWPLKGPAEPQEAQFLGSIKLLLPELATRKMQLHLPVPSDALLIRVTGFLQDNLMEKPTVAAIAKEFAISERSLHRLFVKELGMSFSQYLKIIRMVKAAELLSIPGSRVAAVAYEVGYDSIPSFTRTFRELMGAAPTSFYRDKKPTG